MLSQIVCDMYILNQNFISAIHNTICLVKTGIITFSNNVEEMYFFSFKMHCVSPYVLNGMTQYFERVG